MVASLPESLVLRASGSWAEADIIRTVTPKERPEGRGLVRTPHAAATAAWLPSSRGCFGTARDGARLTCMPCRLSSLGLGAMQQRLWQRGFTPETALRRRRRGATEAVWFYAPVPRCCLRSCVMSYFGVRTLPAHLCQRAAATCFSIRARKHPGAATCLDDLQVSNTSGRPQGIQLPNATNGALGAMQYHPPNQSKAPPRPACLLAENSCSLMQLLMYTRQLLLGCL
eukprot:364372-Chlamydomonas_euryale.AAC.6